MKKKYAAILMLLVGGLFCAGGLQGHAAGDGVFAGTCITGDIEMDYCRFGSGSRVFVILPGLSVKPVTPSAEAIAQGFSDFAEDYTVYLFDRRTNLPESYSIDKMAADTAAVMKALGITKADVFGASQGGMIAQSLAAGYPELVGRLVLGSSASGTNPVLEAVITDWIRLAEAKDGYGLNQAISEAIYSPATLAQYRDILLAAGNDITGEELARFVILASAVSGLDLYDSLDRINCQVLVLGCYGDRVTTAEAARETAERLGCASYFYGEEYGHAVFDEAPDYRQRILAFLNQ